MSRAGEAFALAAKERNKSKDNMPWWQKALIGTAIQTAVPPLLKGAGDVAKDVVLGDNSKTIWDTSTGKDLAEAAIYNEKKLNKLTSIINEGTKKGNTLANSFLDTIREQEKNIYINEKGLNEDQARELLLVNKGERIEQANQIAKKIYEEFDMLSEYPTIDTMKKNVESGNIYWGKTPAARAVTTVMHKIRGKDIGDIKAKSLKYVLFGDDHMKYTQEDVNKLLDPTNAKAALKSFRNGDYNVTSEFMNKLVQSNKQVNEFEKQNIRKRAIEVYTGNFLSEKLKEYSGFPVIERFITNEANVQKFNELLADTENYQERSEYLFRILFNEQAKTNLAKDFSANNAIDIVNQSKVAPALKDTLTKNFGGKKSFQDLNPSNEDDVRMIDAVNKDYRDLISTIHRNYLLDAPIAAETFTQDGGLLDFNNGQKNELYLGFVKNQVNNIQKKVREDGSAYFTIDREKGRKFLNNQFQAIDDGKNIGEFNAEIGETPKDFDTGFNINTAIQGGKVTTVLDVENLSNNLASEVVNSFKVKNNQNAMSLFNSTLARIVNQFIVEDAVKLGYVDKTTNTIFVNVDTVANFNELEKLTREKINKKHFKNSQGMLTEAVKKRGMNITNVLLNEDLTYPFNDVEYKIKVIGDTSILNLFSNKENK